MVPNRRFIDVEHPVSQRHHVAWNADDALDVDVFAIQGVVKCNDIAALRGASQRPTPPVHEY